MRSKKIENESTNHVEGESARSEMWPYRKLMTSVCIRLSLPVKASFSMVS